MAAPVPFSDIAKPCNDLLNKDFFHLSAGNIEVKSKAPNGVSFTAKGKSTHEGNTSGSLEAKWKDASTGVTLTESWSTANSLDTKIEAEDIGTKGLKLEALGNYLPNTNTYGGKINAYFKQENFHTRAFLDPFKGPTATIDAVIGRQGFLVGGEAGYDVQKAGITRYAAAAGYSTPELNVAVAATNNLSVFSATWYQKVNSLVEAGAKATWDSKNSSTVGMELATKYRIDPSSFAKAKINDRGIAALSYSVLLKPGFTLGLGMSMDTQKLSESTHKVGASFTFDA